MHTKKLWLAIGMLLLTMLACTINIGGPQLPEERIPVSTEAVETLHQEIAQAVTQAVDGLITLKINETQLTSYLAFTLAADQNALFREPQVFLRDQQIQIYGRARSGNLEATIGIVLTASVDENGKPRLQIVSADFGPLPVPEGLRQALTTMITEAYTGSLGPVATGFRLENIDIRDGVMTLTGRIR
jgi:uncharacterized protein YpmS